MDDRVSRVPASRPVVGRGATDGSGIGGGSVSGRESYLAVRVLNALLREDYGGLAGRMTHGKDGIALVLPGGRRVRLVPGSLFQDFVAAPQEALRLKEVLHTLREISAPADAAGVESFVRECHEALRALDLHDVHREQVLTRLAAGTTHTGTTRPCTTRPCTTRPCTTHTGTTPAARPGTISGTAPGTGRPAGAGDGTAGITGTGGGRDNVRYETLAAFVDHPVYPTARCRIGLSDEELTAYAPEFAPTFELRWAAVPRARLTGGEVPGAPGFRAVGLTGSLAETHVLFPVHPLTVPALEEIPWATVAPRPYLEVRPTLSMRTVEIAPGAHLKLPLTTSTLGLRNRRSIKPDTLADGARAELLLRAMPDPEVLLADEQTYGHAGHEYLGWLLRRHPAGEVVPVAALAAPLPGGGLVVEELAGRWFGGDVAGLLGRYLRVLFRFHVRLFVRYGTALEAHQQNLSLVFDADTGGEGATGDGAAGDSTAGDSTTGDGAAGDSTADRGVVRLLVKDNDGLLTSPELLREAGLPVPDFTDARMLTDDPHALADMFVTITLHLAAAAVAFGALPSPRAAELVRDALAGALDEYGEDPMARLLRARTLDAARLVGKSMVTAGTLVDKARTGARDVNKFYGTSGPNYLRQQPQATQAAIIRRTP
ncbi:siderophore biosynthesis protein [Streptosporangium sp. NBC_01755]|uniref:IucA/IucC family protein n=1 Tax=unclassified Streptosporangium TaxID=2632669 RepID=UPI002DDA4C58|nr:MULTISPECIES: IucA/IucC family protein [unclassified Streptosporangium]WSA26312.1 siderophore biosynthesis protein [Streptosporangium sp. NBC_01810]WSD02260.1 siderophore biosynthesis protein [Streptosporangium sp. NBC_01755]